MRKGGFADPMALLLRAEPGLERLFGGAGVQLL
jgi:hypothetical protein